MINHAPHTAGPIKAKVCFIGEAPGEDEERHGGAFVGRAGHELKKLCANAGINIEHCRLENVLQFRPEDNNIKPYFSYRGDKAKTSPIFDLAVEALRDRLLETDANIFVPLGNSALYALTGKIGITKYRGSILESTLLPGRKCLPTIHPAAALYGQRVSDKKLFGGGDLSYRYFIAFDLKRVREESLSAKLRIPDRDLITDASFQTIISYLEEIKSRSEVAYDIETTSNYLSHIAFALKPESAICIPFYESGKEVWSPSEEHHLMLLIAQILEDPSIEKIGQNLSFDSSFMNYHYGIHVTPMQDTMIASAILYPDYPKGLDFLVSIYCRGTPYYKSDGKNWFKNPFGSVQEFRRYNAMDAAVLMDIFPAQRRELERSGNWKAYQNQMSSLDPLTFIGNRGILINTEKLEEGAKSTEARILSLEKEIKETVGDININSTKHLMHYFYVDLGIKPYVKKRSQGNSTPTIDEKALQRIANKNAKGSDVARLIIEYRKLTKMYSTYFSIKLDPDNRFRASFNPVGTVNGRPSSSSTLRGTGSNLLNLPPEYQALMIADEGYVIVIQDLAQAENRIVAYEALETRMMQAIENGIDLHIQTGCLIHEVPLDKCTPEIRFDGKVANHGLNYGFGDNEFCLMYELELDKGKWIWNRYHAIYPGIRTWHASIREELSHNKMTLTNCFGRRRSFIGPWGNKLFQKAYNYRPQSAVAHKINQDGLSYLYYNQDLFEPVILCNTVYDSLWYLVPTSDLSQAVHYIDAVRKKLEETITINNRECYIPVDTKIGFNINEELMLSWKSSHVKDTSHSDLVEELEHYVYEN